ncbi:monovalent cation/H(+) antiporter subunit G [Brooklawnia sp.]|uniref:monovalent cation/H(+) antiporter subunit G n=1 Tax=Brooklawnia sp. TaxID=2699740 RepID=UPI00311FF868
MTVWLQVIGVTLIAAGVLLTFITALGMLRLGSLFSRMHASTKPQVLGLGLMCAGLALVIQKPHLAATLVLVVMMQFFVAPISAHMLGRATYRLGQTGDDAIVVDEYAEDIERARKGLADGDPSRIV